MQNRIENYDFSGKKAIVRVDFNVPIQEGKITDDTRIRGAIPTLKLILEKGGALIIMSHMGKPKGKVKPELSLSQIVDAVSEKLGVPVKFAPDCQKADELAAALKPGEVLLLENLRYYPEEEGKPVGIDKEDPAYEEAKKAIIDGTLHVFATDTFTVGGEKLDSYMADVDTDADYTPDTEVISDGYFHESEMRSAPYFNLEIDGITLLNKMF